MNINSVQNNDVMGLPLVQVPQDPAQFQHSVAALASLISRMGIGLAEKVVTDPEIEEKVARFTRTDPELLKQHHFWLLSRVLFETCGTEMRSGLVSPEVATIDKLSGGGSPVRYAAFAREDLRDFCADHPDLQDKLKPILQTVDIDCAVNRGMWTNQMIFEDMGKEQESFIKNAYHKKFASLMEAKLEALGPGESLGVPLTTPDHVTFLEMRKAQDGTYTCLVYNTGEGSAEHLNVDGKVYPLVWTNVKTDLVGRDFFQKVFSFGVRWGMAMCEVTNYLRSVLGRENSNAALSERPYRDQGSLGSCSYKSRSVWLHSAMAAIQPGLYERFRMESTARLIRKFVSVFPEVIKKNGQDDDPNRVLEGSHLNLGQLRVLHTGAGETLLRRMIRYNTHYSK